ncbi:MAG: ATP cone domain-containing protein [Patescibacteria group bacterium]
MSSTDVIIVKSNGERERFDIKKLETSLAKLNASGRVIGLICDHVVKELREGMSTSEIYTHAYSLLRRHERPVALKYSIRRAVTELGPSGFPFEKFIAEVYKARGYKAETNLSAMGHCVEHEVDVMAWNENKLIIAEAKFHNAIGLKSDLKVALYVKARFDDLKDTLFSVEGKKRKFDEACLITNTKFTSHATNYAECSNLRIIGWNYPKEGNLHSIIEDFNLHPITALTTLSSSEKRDFILKGLVLTKNLSSDILINNSIKETRVDSIIQEIRELHQPYSK